MKGFLSVSLVIAVLAGCAVERNDYSYGYYTGIKNPRVKRSDAADDEVTAAQQPAVQAIPPATTDKPPPEYHLVSKGETLYSIAWQYGHDVRDVAAWNHIRAPYTIYPNQRIRTRPPRVVARPAPTPSPYPTARKYSPPAVKTKPAAIKKTKTKKIAAKSDKISWQWPTKGNIITKYSASDAGKKGLDIAGKEGQAIYAAASGDIVYSGNGLRGYGQLIIIKHNDTYLSAYAHNKRLHVKENQKVKKGQHIADMGSSEAEQPMLHFEVRRNGKPDDPLRYLPARR